MNPFAAYRAVNTKLCSRRKNLLTGKEWEKAVNFQSITQISDFLKKKTSFNQVITERKIEELHRMDLEVILDRYVVREIENMLHYFSGAYKDFFKVFLMEYDILDIELILRTIVRDEELDEMDRYFVHSDKYSECNYDKLLGCKNVSQFIEGLKGTNYYNVLKTMTQDDVTKREFHMEMKLYILFYKTLMEKAAKLKPMDYEIAKKVIGTKIDFINVQWIFRATKYYHISSEEILIYSLPFGYKLTYQKLKDLSYSKNLVEFQKNAEKYLGCEIFNMTEDAYLEQAIDRHFYKAISSSNTQVENIATALGYIYTLDIEVKDLIALIEGVRYTLPEGEIKKYLVHTI